MSCDRRRDWTQRWTTFCRIRCGRDWLGIGGIIPGHGKGSSRLQPRCGFDRHELCSPGRLVRGCAKRNGATRAAWEHRRLSCAVHTLSSVTLPRRYAAGRTRASAPTHTVVVQLSVVFMLTVLLLTASRTFFTYNRSLLSIAGTPC